MNAHDYPHYDWSRPDADNLIRSVRREREEAEQRRLKEQAARELLKYMNK